jgi:hypothetical protein
MTLKILITKTMMITDPLNFEYLLDLYHLLSIEIKIAKQQSDARAQAYFNLDDLIIKKQVCYAKLERFIPEDFITEFTKTN